MRYTFELARGVAWARWVVEPVVAGVLRRDVRARLEGLKKGLEVMNLTTA